MANDRAMFYTILLLQADDQTFEFPDLFKSKQTEQQKSTNDFRKAVNESKRDMPKVWDRMDLPPWFR